MRFVSLLLVLFYLPLAFGDYSQCILENMKGVGSDIAALEIRGACKEKYDRDLSQINSEMVEEPNANESEPSPEQFFNPTDSKKTDSQKDEHKPELDFNQLTTDERPDVVWNSVEGSSVKLKGLTRSEVDLVKQKFAYQSKLVLGGWGSTVPTPSSNIELIQIRKNLEDSEIEEFVIRSQTLTQNLLKSDVEESEDVILELTNLVLNTNTLNNLDKIKFLEGYLKYYLSVLKKPDYCYGKETVRWKGKKYLEKFNALLGNLFFLTLEENSVPVDTLGLLLRYSSFAPCGPIKTWITELYEEVFLLSKRLGIPDYLISEILLDYADNLVLKNRKPEEISNAYQRYFESLGNVNETYVHPKILTPYLEVLPVSSLPEEKLSSGKFRIVIEVGVSGKQSKIVIRKGGSARDRRFLRTLFRNARFRPAFMNDKPIKSEVEFELDISSLRDGNFRFSKALFLLQGIKVISFPSPMT